MLDNDEKLIEQKKNRQERIIIVILAFLILIIAWAEYRLIGISHTLPFEHSLFFLGLVNFNIILFLLLLFLIFRNVFKTFSKRQKGPLGSSLKSKLIASFVGFSFVPTVIMFLVSVFYINNSFEKWFNQRVTQVLKSSIEISNSYYLEAKKRNYHFAKIILKEVADKDLQRKKTIIKFLLNQFRLDSIQYYSNMIDPPIEFYSDKFNKFNPPPVASIDFLAKGLREQSEASLIHQYSHGNLVRVIVPDKEVGGAIVLSSYIPLSLVSKIDDVSSVYNELVGVGSIQYPMKSIYLIILILITLVILLSATWSGFYLAKQLTVSLYLIGKAAQRVAKGNYKPLRLNTGSPEVNQLVENFNIMAKDLSESEARIAKAERLAAWQEVAKRMAHEVKNPLTPISLAAQRLERKFSSQITDKAFSECTQMIINQVNNLKSLVNEFSQFARLPEARMKPYDICQSVLEVTNFFKQAHKKINFQVTIQEESLMAYFDKDQIMRVMTNLLDNAVAAVSTKDNPMISVLVKVQDNKRNVEILVLDNGSGIPANLLDKVFEPYVTSKLQGTGLGLAIVKKTIEDHKGQVYVKALKDKGTEFGFTLPLHIS